MIYILIIAALILLALMYMSFEATWIDVRRIYFSKDRNALKVLQLSDIHISRLKVNHRIVKEIIESENPDVIILTGDYIEEKQHVQDFFKFFDNIRNDCRNIYFCLGNHDYEAFWEDCSSQEDFIRSMESRGCMVLHNASVCYQKGSKKYNIIGIADMRYKKHDIQLTLQNCCKDASASIAFSHNPDIVLEIPKGSIDYLFCGHFHGGQIWAPFNIEFAILRREKLCKMGITRGLHKVNNINLYINKGLGNVVFPLRFFSRPEITLFYLP